VLFSVQLCGQLYQPHDTVDSYQALIERAIMAFCNDIVDDFNNLLVERMPGAEPAFMLPIL